MRFLGGAYVWQNLEKKSVVQKFKFPAPTNSGPFWFEVQVSSVGWQSLDDVEILLDGKKLELEGIGTSDRSFFNTKRVQDLNPGDHTLEIREVRHDGDNILAFANLYAYEADYDFNGGVGAFKTYDQWNSLTYRPTHGQCIMRDMLYEFFCSVDQENMWINFLNRTSLIDQVVVDQDQIKVLTPQLSGLSIRWFKIDGTAETEMLNLQNKFFVDRTSLSAGNYNVKVQFLNDEIRKTSPNTIDQSRFSIQ
jgi:hypothetical protein